MLYTNTHRELMRSVTKFVETEIDPHAEEWEAAGMLPAHELFRKMGQQGLLGIHKPEKFGGQGLVVPCGGCIIRKPERLVNRAAAINAKICWRNEHHTIQVHPLGILQLECKP